MDDSAQAGERHPGNNPSGTNRLPSVVKELH
jgi:hypothetical protein